MGKYIQTMTLKEQMMELELRLVLTALNQTNGVRSKAALMLGCNRTTLVEIMRKHGILRSIPSGARTHNKKAMIDFKNDTAHLVEPSSRIRLRKLRSAKA